VRSPIIELNRAVAVGMAEGPAVALVIVDELAHEPALKNYHLLGSVRGDLLCKLALCGSPRGVRGCRRACEQQARTERLKRAPPRRSGLNSDEAELRPLALGEFWIAWPTIMFLKWSVC